MATLLLKDNNNGSSPSGDWPNLQAALYDFTNAFIEEYKRRLIEDGKSASGNLIDSISLPNIEYVGNGYEASISLADYWKYVEYGRKPGKFPPPNVILNWIRVKPVLPRPVNGITPTENQLAFLIGRKIATEGIEPGNQFEETLDRMLTEYESILSEAISADLEDMTSLERLSVGNIYIYKS